MKIYLSKAIFVNRAPFEKLDIDFSENEIAILSGVNGRGKTTILSHIVDAIYELVRDHFPNEFKNKENEFYRVSSSVYNLDNEQPSFVYLRFKTLKDDSEEIIDYLDIRGACNEKQYVKAINLENRIPFNNFREGLSKHRFVKKIFPDINQENIITLFRNNLMTYFPSYRYEQPGYLNKPYEIKLNFKKNQIFSGYLDNPIEVISGLPQLANWVMDVVLDNQYLNVMPETIVDTIKNMDTIPTLLTKKDLPTILKDVIQTTIQNYSKLQKNLSSIITNILISKKCGNIRFGIAPRNSENARIRIVEAINGTPIYPSIFDISSGESSLLCLFGELLRQADNIRNNISLSEIKGIVLIDEIDKHLHIKLQKEVLPNLFNLFPNVQFIVSSHSPFLSMGLAEDSKERSKIIDLDNLGISKKPTEIELYKEVYDMMINENERFKEMYESLEEKIKQNSIPLIITEGNTDIEHIKKAEEKLKITDLNIEFYETTESFGDSKLKTLLEQLSKIQHSRKIIGIFDRDNPEILKEIENGNQLFKDYGNNVFAFCIPIPKNREEYKNISIEFYYKDSEVRKKKDGKCLYFDNEIEFLFNKTLKKHELRKSGSIRKDKEYEKKIFDQDLGEANWIHSKSVFAKLIKNDENFIKSFNFNNFDLIFSKIREIIK